MTIRPGTHADADAIERICLVTGRVGQDATGAYGDDAVLSDVYATPYLFGPSSFCLVWEDNGKVLGYVLGASDTREFQKWFVEEWWPGAGASREPRTDMDRDLFKAAANPTRMLVDEVDRYPAHLHIDLLPEAQGKGAGRALIEACVELQRDRGIPGLHLVAENANEVARAFYPRVGFEALRTFSGVTLFARTIEV